MPLIDDLSAKMVGHVLIRDQDTGEVLLDKMNAINYETMSQALAWGLANRAGGHINEMVFGNGASTVSGTGAIHYFPPNVSALDSQLYNQTASKIVDDQSPLMPVADRPTNKINVQHTAGTTYTDVIVICTLNYNEPTSGQDAFDDGSDMDGLFVFDELGLKAYDPVANNGRLLTHIVFHPIKKSLNRIISIEYTLRIYLS